VSNSPESGKKVSNKPKRANGRGSIYQITRSNGRKVWKAAIKDINGKLRTKNFTKLAEAEDWVAEQRRARELGENTYATNPKMTVAEFMTGWVESKYSDDQSNTKRFYTNAIVNHIIPTLGNIKASNLTSKSIEQLLRDMAAQNYGAGTIKAARAALSAAYSDAKRHGDLVRNPVENVKMPNVQSVPTTHIPRADWEKIYIAAMSDPYMHARIEIAGTWGLRPGEALGLKWEDLDVESKTLRIARQIQRVKGKGLIVKSVKQKKERAIFISEAAVQILLTHKRYQALQKASWVSDEGLIFPNSLGKPLDEKADRNRFKKLTRLAGTPDYELYQLRKTAFTAMASQTDLKTLMEFSGHTQVSTVMESYVFATTESMKKAVSGMDQLRPEYKEPSIKM
jgi:integrase